MRTAIDRVMQAFSIMTRLTPERAEATPARLTAHSAGMDADENALAVEGLCYLRGSDRHVRRE
jgi:hypothetical protein